MGLGSRSARNCPPSQTQKSGKLQARISLSPCPAPPHPFPTPRALWFCARGRLGEKDRICVLFSSRTRAHRRRRQRRARAEIEAGGSGATVRRRALFVGDRDAVCTSFRKLQIETTHIRDLSASHLRDGVGLLRDRSRRARLPEGLPDERGFEIVDRRAERARKRARRPRARSRRSLVRDSVAFASRFRASDRFLRRVRAQNQRAREQRDREQRDGEWSDR